MNLLLIRHAESNGNAAGGDYSVENSDALSSRGRAQAEALAVCLGAWDIDAVIVSPQQRALQTIAPYLAATGRTAEVWPELAEACWHEEREPVAEAWGAEPASLPTDIAQHFFFRDGQAIRPGPPDGFGAGLRRVYDALERIERTFGGSEQTILMASHRFFIKETLALMLRQPVSEAFHQDNGGMTLMSYSKEWKMKFCNREGSGIS
jgi:broad specificity phosphatase PhoE